MKNILNGVTLLGAGVLGLLLVSTITVSAQHRGSFRGGISFGFGGGFFGPSFGFGYRSYYRPSYYGGYVYGVYPGLGLSFGYLPNGYYPFYYGPDLYYGFDGVYYRQHDQNYEVVAPPVGAEVPRLPSHAKPITINGEQYYELNGVYYKEVIHADNTKAYLIAGKDGVLNTAQQPQQRPLQIGDTVNDLPKDCRTVTLNNKRYYVAPDDVYYEETVDNGGTSAYKVVSVPAQPKQSTTPPPARPDGY